MKKNLNLYIFVALMVVFTFGYFTTAINISYAFLTGEESTSYDAKINLIKKVAIAYVENTSDLFNDTDTIYITVGELVEKGYIISDNEHGDVKDPSSEIKTLNDLKLRITNKADGFDVKVLENNGNN